MSDLNLYIFVEDHHTRTMIGGAKGHTNIVFHNESNKPLTVTFDIDMDVGKTLIVTPGNLGKVKCKPNHPKKGQPGSQIKYTAQIQGAAAEDPIIVND